MVLMAGGVRSSWEEWEGARSRVVSLGLDTRDSLNTLDGQRIIVIIPGNPGLGSMYQDFMVTLCDCLSAQSPPAAIWTLSYVGHETDSPPLLPTAPTYNLETQIQHKIALLQRLVPRTAQLTLIGHSIGCKICMEIFKRNTSHNIKDVFFLFPTIENMVSTVRGQQTLPWVTTFRLLAVVLMTLLSLLPDCLLRLLLQLRYRKASTTFVSSTLDFVNANQNELETVLDLDTDTIRNMVGKLHLYHGVEDGWSPLAYRDNLLASVPEFPESEAVVDTRNIPHAFVEFTSEVTAQAVADWMLRLDAQR